MRNLVSSVLLTGLLIGCGGSTPKQQDPAIASSGQGEDASSETKEPIIEETAEEKFSRQKSDTVEKVCEIVAGCMVQFAKENMSPEEIEKNKIDDPQTLVMAADKCQENYSGAMSPQQVIGIRECISTRNECSVFLECFGTALSPAQ